MEKNRFENIYSCIVFYSALVNVVTHALSHADDHCCVHLTPIEEEDGSDYINASWINVSPVSTY